MSGGTQDQDEMGKKPSSVFMCKPINRAEQIM